LIYFKFYVSSLNMIAFHLLINFGHVPVMNDPFTVQGRDDGYNHAREKFEFTDVEKGFIFCMALILGNAIGFVVYDSVWDDSRELGQVICDANHGGNFHYYDGNTVFCKNLQEKIEYDGIEVVVNHE